MRQSWVRVKRGGMGGGTADASKLMIVTHERKLTAASNETACTTLAYEALLHM